MTVAVLYAITILAVGGIVLLVARRWLKTRWSALASLGVGAIALLALLLARSGPMELTLARWVPTSRWAIVASYRFDTISQSFGLLAAGVAFLLLLWMALAEEEGAFSPWVLLLLAVFLHLLSCTDLILAYASWEVLLLTTYWMLVSRRSALPTPGIAEWFLGGQHLAGYLLLLALLLVGRAAGTTLYPALDIGAVGTVPLLLVLGTAWIRTAQVPFQGWALAVAESPGPVHTLVLGGFNLLAGPYLWLRFLSRAATHSPHQVVMALGTVSLLLGAVLALRRESSRQVQAGDTVSRLGLVWIALGLDGHLGLAAGLLLLLDLLLSKVLFHVALSGSRGVDRPLRQGLFLLGAWGAVGLPPSPGFLGRWLLLVGLLRLGQPAYIPLVLLALPLTVAYLWRGWTWLQQAQDQPGRLELLSARIMAGLLALAPLSGLAMPWLWQHFFERVPLVATGTLSIEVRLLLGSMTQGMVAWVVLLLLLGALGSWWLGAWRRLPAAPPVAGEAAAPELQARPAEPAENAPLPMPASLAIGPLQEALPVLPQESSWLAWVGRPAQLYRTLAQALAWVGQLFQSIVTFLERHTTYYLLAVLVVATVILIVLTR